MYALRYARGGESCDSQDICFVVKENSSTHRFLLRKTNEAIRNGAAKRGAFYGPFASQEAAVNYGITLSEIAHPSWNFRPGGNRSWAPHIERSRPSEDCYLVHILHPWFGG